MEEETFIEGKLRELKELIDDINFSIGCWKNFDDNEPEYIEQCKKEDAILKDLVGSLLNVYTEFKKIPTTLHK